MQQTDKAVKQTEWNDLGIIIDGAYDSADYINKATAELAERFGFDFDPPNVDDEDEDHGQIWSEIGDSAVNYLNDNLTLPSYCSFYFEDNSLFCSPSIESAREDVEFVSSKRNEYPSDDYEGEWLHVNDHGNATLYVRNDKGEDNEIWSLV